MTDERIYAATQNAPGFQQPGDSLRPYSNLAQYVRQYTRERPEVVALWCLGIGFVLGWKLKMW